VVPLSFLKQRDRFNPEEYTQLYAATRECALNPKRENKREDCEDTHDYVPFMANTGLRPDEANRLQLRDVKVVIRPHFLSKQACGLR
jgi:hypothetical protein